VKKEAYTILLRAVGVGSSHPGSQLKEARIFDPLDWDQNTQARVDPQPRRAKKRSFAAASKSSRASPSAFIKKK
jgi:hypothetical protein